jgi:hypothetical protein
MKTEQIGDYEIEYSAEQLPEAEGWAAFLTVYGPSPNPMHRNPIFPRQRVCVDTMFSSEQEAEAGAHKHAVDMIEHY